MAGTKRRSVPFLLLVEDEIYGDEGFDFDGFAVQARGLIAPLEHGLSRRSCEDRISADHFELADGAVGRDDGAQVHRACKMNLACEVGILRLHFVD